MSHAQPARALRTNTRAGGNLRRLINHVNFIIPVLHRSLVLSIVERVPVCGTISLAGAILIPMAMFVFESVIVFGALFSISARAHGHSTLFRQLGVGMMEAAASSA